jgi:iron complex transport system substrate-binding protein
MRLFLLFVVGLLSSGCGSPPAPRAPEGADGHPGYPLTLADDLGRTVTLPRRPERIVSIAPGQTETLFAVGAGPRVVAVTTVDTYPPEVKGLPKVGGFGPKTINLEAILAQRPDLVLTTGRLHQQTVEALERLGVVAFAREPSSFEEVAASIETVGRLTDCEAKANGVAADFRRRLAAARERTAALRSDAPTVLYVVSDEPLMVAGPRTFVGQLLELAGGRNVFADLAQQYPRVSDEAVLRRDPAVILAPDHGVSGIAARLRRRPGWDRLRAVRSGRVHTVHEDLVSRPGPRLVEGLEAVEKVLARGGGQGR